LQQENSLALRLVNKKAMNTRSTINIDILLDENKLPEEIRWNAPGSTAEDQQKAKAMMLAFWDGADKSALRIDLWAKDMFVDEMGDFFYQCLVSMADTYNRATGNDALTDEMKKFAADFYQKARTYQKEK
jgi:gliding motility-associated protein GldC